MVWQATMTVLYLTNNAQLASTGRILQSWIKYGARQGITCCVVVPAEGALSRWLEEAAVPTRVSAMPWPDRRWPFPAFREAWRLARWAKRSNVSVIHCNE